MQENYYIGIQVEMSKIFYAKKVQELNEIAKAIVEVFENEKKFVFFTHKIIDN